MPDHLIESKLNNCDMVIGGTEAFQTKMQLLFCMRRGIANFPKNFMIKKQMLTPGPGPGAALVASTAVIQLVPNMLSKKLPLPVHDAGDLLPASCVNPINREPYPFQYVLLNDLLPNTLYRFTVLPTRSSKSGKASISVDNRTLEMPPSKPPTLTASRLTSNRRDVLQYDLRFAPPPEDAQHGAIKQYAVTVLDVSQRLFNRSLIAAAEDHHVISILPNRNFLVALSAINKAGASPSALVVIDANGQVSPPGGAGDTSDPANVQLFELMQMIESQSRNSNAGASVDPDWILLDSDAKLGPGAGIAPGAGAGAGAGAEPPFDEYVDEGEEPYDPAPDARGLGDASASSTAASSSSIVHQWWFVAGLALLVGVLWILICVGFIFWYRKHCRLRTRHDKQRNKSDILLHTFSRSGSPLTLSSTN